MYRFLFIILLFLSSLSYADSFRFHLLAEPHTLDPQTTAANSGNYVFHSIYRGLFRYHSRRGLIKEGAKDCVRQHLALVCHLNPAHHWSNGGQIKAADYVKSFRRLIDPKIASPQVELILSLKNAKAIWLGKLPVDQLGVKAVDDMTLKFEFAFEDSEFEFKLVSSALSPWPPTGIPGRDKASELVVSGPYKITEWKSGHWIKLSPNKNYGLPANPDRPELEALFIENDYTALGLYESGKLNFLRRLTAGEIPRFRNSRDFIQVAMARFDYIGFGPQLKALPHLREALVSAVEFSGFMQLFDTKGPPGCPSLPARLLDRSPCLKFSPAQAKSALKKEKQIPKLEFSFSRMGGDDISRAAEWFQGQWKKNLNLQVTLSPIEQLMYLQRLRADPPPIFRKGVSLDRPTCLAALELFTKGHPENYIHFEDPEYEKLVERLRISSSDSERKVRCRKGIEYLLNSHRLLPLGEMYFTMLASPKFKDWDVNELNQLDLTDLHTVP